ncbi:MAG: tetratricopeptide repeat protein [Planctomycetota bacterium]
MLRLIGFFVVVLLALQVLRHVPVIGRFFDIPILGFWGAAILVSAGASKLAALAVDRRRFARQRRALTNVETPHNQGKLGTLLLASGRMRAAIEPLQRAAAGEPDSATWAYRLGSALLGAGRAADAVPPLARAAELDEEHAYGAVLLRLAEALTKNARGDEALTVLERFDKNHGESPESAFRRADALRVLGRKSEARASYRRVRELHRSAVRYQRTTTRSFALRALLWSYV